MEFKLEGVDELIKGLNALPDEVEKALLKASELAARKVADDTRMLAPVAEVNGGTLRDSISYRVTPTGFEVFSTVEHSTYVEFGTGQRGEGSPHPPGMELDFRADWAGMPAQPYMYPAYLMNKDYIMTKYKEELDNV